MQYTPKSVSFVEVEPFMIIERWLDKNTHILKGNNIRIKSVLSTYQPSVDFNPT